MNNTKNYTKYSARDAESVRSLDKWKQSNGNNKSGNNNRTARRRNDYGSHVNQDYQVPSRRRNDNYIQTARGGWYKLAETEQLEQKKTGGKA